MCVVLFFPQGFNETAHKFEEGYLEEDERGICAMDRASDLNKNKCVNHNFIPEVRGKRKTAIFWIRIDFGTQSDVLLEFRVTAPGAL